MHHPSSYDAAHAHPPLWGFRGISRQALTTSTLALSMMLIFVHDVPVSATPVDASEHAEDTQKLDITPASLTSPVSIPVTTERDGFDITLYTPVQYPLNPNSTISSHFGGRHAPCAGCSTAHSGVDWTPGRGTPVEAIADGIVISREMGGWGSYVVIEHDIDGERVLSGYAHLIAGSNLPVGTVVSRGDVVGRVGNTGQSTGNHLHFSIILGNDNFVNPITWLKKHATEEWGS